MRRRRWLVAIVILLVAGVAVGLTLALSSSGGSGQATPGLSSHLGFSRIPALTRIASGPASLCSGFKSEPPSYCSQGGPGLFVRGSEQVWALTAAVETYGMRHVPQPIPLRLARQHPGPAEVVVDVLTLANASVANRYMPLYAHTEGYTALPTAGINSGIAARIDSLANDGLSEVRFAWVGGRSIVEVNILGADLTVGEAQRVAHLARPS